MTAGMTEEVMCLPEAASLQLWLMIRSLSVALPPAEPVLQELLQLLPIREADSTGEPKVPWWNCPARPLVHWEGRDSLQAKPAL